MKHIPGKPDFGAGLALAALVAALVAALAPAHAAAGGGGLNEEGAASCARQVREYKGGMPSATMVRGWIAGGTGAPDKASGGTFGLVPWHDLDSVTSVIAGYCANNPKNSLAQAVSGLASALAHQRLKTASAPLRLRSGGSAFVMYGKALTRIARTLAARGR